MGQPKAEPFVLSAPSSAMLVVRAKAFLFKIIPIKSFVFKISFTKSLFFKIPGSSWVAGSESGELTVVELSHLFSMINFFKSLFFNDQCTFLKFSLTMRFLTPTLAFLFRLLPRVVGMAWLDVWSCGVVGVGSIFPDILLASRLVRNLCWAVSV